MTATVQSAYCKATTDYYHYAPYPDWIQIDIDITDQSWYTQCYLVKIVIIADGVETFTTASMGGTGKLTWYHTPSDPGDNNLHSYQYNLTYYKTKSSETTPLGTDYVYNYYNTSVRYYYMQGRMGSFSVTEDSWSVPETYPVITDSSTATWKLHPLMNTSYPAIDVNHEFICTYDGVEYTPDTMPWRIMEWYSWNDSDHSMYYNNMTGKSCGLFKFSYTFQYYDGTKDSTTGQYKVKTYTKTNVHNFTVYEQVEPTFKISEVLSTGYGSSEGTWVTDTAPYEGKAPYKVTWYDTTIDEHPYAVPQQTISWNFGDQDSGSSNQATQTNSTTSLIRATSQTHEYPDYDRYTCTMTVTDKRGNILSSSETFAPSTKQRQFNTPTLTPTSGYQPLLCTGKADVTGSPAPEPTWTYTHRTYTSYTGKVTGDYVEFSLLKDGKYGVVYEVSLEGVTTTKTFNVRVNAGTVIPDNSQEMDDFALIVLDDSGTPVDWCKQHTSIQYIEYYQDLDVFSFEIPQTYKYAKYLQEGDYLLLGYKGKARLMQVTYRGRNGSTITISGESVFPERVAITATRSTANEGYDVQSYKGESLVRYFIQSCLKDPYPDTEHTPSTQPRGANFVVYGSDAEQGGDVTYSARYDKLRDIVNEVCKSANIGYTITARQTGPTYAGLGIVVGTDRTYTSGDTNMVVFSPERLKNCTIESDQSALSSNVSIGAGAGVGSIRTYIYSGTDTLTGFDRREMFTDAGDSADDDEVKRMSELALKEDKQMSIRIRVLPTCQWTFGTGYNVGDVVTLESPDRGSLDLQIYSAESCRRATGDELYLNLGYECASAPTLIRRTAKENTYARK